MDGDAKINFKEFEMGMKSTLTVFGEPKKKKRPKSSNNISQRLTQTASKANLNRNHTPRKPSIGTPRGRSANSRNRGRIASSKSIGRKKLQNQPNYGRAKGF